MPRLRRLAGAALALGLVASAPRAARAQACEAGTLEAYFNRTTNCTLGGFAFSPFELFLSSTEATGSGVLTVLDPTAVAVTPFADVDALGRPTFGFRFVGLEARAQVPGGAAGAGRAEAGYSIGWSGTSLGATEIARAGVSLTLAAATETAARTKLELNAGAQIFGAGPATQCFDDGRSRQGPTNESVTLSRRCEPGRAIDVFTFVNFGAEAERGTSARTESGTAIARIDAVTYTAPAVVPEPATLALVGAGLAAAGLAARRRA